MDFWDNKTIFAAALATIIIPSLVFMVFHQVSTSYELKDMSSGNQSESYQGNYTHYSESLGTTLKKPNISAWITEGGRIPGYALETNSKGFREDSFSKEKPDGTYRIIVLGDSQTMGWGVNESDRYTDLLETRMNSRLEKDVQILNLAMSGHGFKDFYKVLTHRALKYDPDTIVVAHSTSSLLSVSDQREIHREISDNHDNISFKERQKIYFRKTRRLLNRKDKSNVTKYWIEKFANEISDKKIVFYSYHSASDYSEVVESRAAQENISLIEGPKEVGLKHVISRSDPHFNEKGHKIHAEQLFNNLSHLFGYKANLSEKSNVFMLEIIG